MNWVYRLVWEVKRPDKGHLNLSVFPTKPIAQFVAQLMFFSIFLVWAMPMMLINSYADKSEKKGMTSIGKDIISYSLMLSIEIFRMSSIPKAWDWGLMKRILSKNLNLPLFVRTAIAASG